MAEGNPQTSAVPPNPAPKTGGRNYSQVPITEEFDNARWTLPPAGRVAIGIGVIAVLVAAFAFFGRAKPGATGSINDVGVVQMADNNVMVTIQVSLWNPSEKLPFYIRSVKGELEGADGMKFTDSAASAIDFDRYFQAFPELKLHAGDPLLPETKISPGGMTRGTIIVTFPVTKEQFEQRKSIAVIVDPYDQQPVTIRK